MEGTQSKKLKADLLASHTSLPLTQNSFHSLKSIGTMEDTPCKPSWKSAFIQLVCLYTCQKHLCRDGAAHRRLDPPPSTNDQLRIKTMPPQMFTCKSHLCKSSIKSLLDTLDCIKLTVKPNQDTAPRTICYVKKKKDLIDQYLVGRNHLSYMSFLMLTAASMTQCIISDCWFGYELQLGAAVWAVMVIVRVEYTAPFWDIFVSGESYRKVLLGLVLFHQAPARGPSRKTEVQSGVCQATVPDCSSNR